MKWFPISAADIDLRTRSAQRWIVALAALLFFWNLWGYDLWAPDEPFFGEGAREMVVDGQWLVPHVNGKVNNHKPPLFFWLIAGFSELTGKVTPLTTRLPSAFAGIGTLLLTMLLARRLRSPEAAGLCGVMLITSHMFWEKSRWSQIDATLCLLVTVALVAFVQFRSERWSGRAAGLVFWGACALATLAKGPVGLLIPLGVVLATSIWDRKLLELRNFAPVLGPLLFVGIGLAWAVPATLYVDGYSTLQALREHFVDRGTQGLHHPRPWWYYGKVLPYALLPWSLLLPGAVLYAWRGRQDPTNRFLLSWAGFVLLMFSVSVEKRDLYILPAFPAFFLMIGRLIADHLGWSGDLEARANERQARVSPAWIFYPLGATAALLAGLSIYAPILARQEAPPAVFPLAILLAFGLALSAAWLAHAVVRRRAASAVGRLAAVTSFLFLLAVTLVYPQLNTSKSGRELARVVEQEVTALRSETPDARFYGLNIMHLHRHISFYSNGIYVEIVDQPTLVRRARTQLRADKPVLLYTKTAIWEELPAELRAKGRVLYETRLSRRDTSLVRFDPAPTDGSVGEPVFVPSVSSAPPDATEASRTRDTSSGSGEGPVAGSSP